MNYRLSLAAACVAAFGLACTEAPKPAPAKVEKMATAARKVGTFTMSITPNAENGGRTARIEVSPDSGTGRLVDVSGRFEVAVVPAGGTSLSGGPNPCATAALSAPVKVTNKAPETIKNVQVQILGMAITGREACNSDGVLGAMSPVAAVSPGRTFGAWNYGNLTGTSAADLTTSALTKIWWMKFPSNTPVRFQFVVWADAGQAELNAVGPELEVGQPVAWTSATSAVTQFDMCLTDPALTGNECPPSEEFIIRSATAAPGPYAFSMIPGTVAGSTYWWRVFNVISWTDANLVVHEDVGFYPSPWDSFTAVAPLVVAAPVISAPIAGSTFTADVPALLLDWTTDLAITTSVFQVCTGPCPAPFALVDPNLANLVVEGVEPGFLAAAGVTSYSVDLVPLLPVF